MISKDIIEKAIFQIEQDSDNKNTDLFCSTRDIFQARIDNFTYKSQLYFQSAVIGEIGNNTFDHNWDFEQGKMKGAYLNFNLLPNFVILADFGRGIKNSLSKIQDLKDDKEALQIAFTKIISGRAPEQRGNGLKFVKDSCINNNWDLYFQSGYGSCSISDGNVIFEHQKNNVIGCLAILNFNGR